MNYRELKTPKDENIYILFRTSQIVKGVPRALYFVMDEKSHVERDLSGLKYFYEQHTCPTNFLRGVVKFLDETAPGRYEDDPHGLFEVVGWCTEKEGLETFKLGTSFDGPIEDPNESPTSISGLDFTSFINEMLKRFREPPADWMNEILLDPSTVGRDLFSDFLRKLKKACEDKISQRTPAELSALMALHAVTIDGKVQFGDNIIDHAAELVELAAHLKLEFKFGS